MIDNHAKNAVVVASKLSGSLAQTIWSYLGLFRVPNSNRVLSWERVCRLILELDALVKAKDIQWDGGRIYANSPRYWEEAVKTMLETEAVGKLKRPIKNHNYLRAVAYEKASREFEREVAEKEKRASFRAVSIEKHEDKTDLSERQMYTLKKLQEINTKLAEKFKEKEI